MDKELRPYLWVSIACVAKAWYVLLICAIELHCKKKEEKVSHSSGWHCSSLNMGIAIYFWPDPSGNPPWRRPLVCNMPFWSLELSSLTSATSLVFFSSPEVTIYGGAGGGPEWGLDHCTSPYSWKHAPIGLRDNVHFHVQSMSWSHMPAGPLVVIIQKPGPLTFLPFVKSP